MRTIQALTLWVMAMTSGKALSQEIPAEFHGTWKPRHQHCQGGAAMVVDRESITLKSTQRSQRFSNVDVCASCEGGARYSGIVVWAMPGALKGDIPFTVKFNADEQRGVAVIEAGDAESLARRFAVVGVPLEKCP
ncbi:MAG: hypothetical protein IIA03_10805 [Proteobacteria bacterium]|jgi:hypothetical protein|nr:hypothetical protein [Methylibium sp.]MBY0364649.1 hypothetical protein [Burkholderiaceae bacterium]MCH8856705.1 hypothetical protein [Pseudomonadota bacterium]|mmetsp:Transcript_20422/g.48674  ORF Transcript_20422/g.48674 Transcript_20422/m.48674 type:complete len:135 (-) Transcript_20422:1186-1590(-)